MATRICPYCKEKVKKDAVVCKHCHKDLPPLPKVPFYKRPGYILIAILIILAIYASQQSETKKENTVQQTTQQKITTPTKSPMDLVSEIEKRMKEYKIRIKKYYPEQEMLEQLNKDAVVLAQMTALYKNSNDKEHKMLYEKSKKLGKENDILRREVLAKILEEKMLKTGQDYSINAIGENKDTLKIKHVFINRPFVHNFTNNNEMTMKLKNAGFKKLILTDGFDSTWTIDLKK